VRDAGLLVRPHPQNAEQWRDVELATEFANVAVYPKAGLNPIGGTARADYFDSMFHAEAVVGVNTSGMIESGIIGTPVFAVQVPDFAATQDGTLHFQHLKNVEGGLLNLATTLDEHVTQLGQVLDDAGAARLRARRFIQAFVRPHGLDTAATPLLVSELESFAAGPRLAPRPEPVHAAVLRFALAPLALGLMLVATDPIKRRAIVLHWTRPARLAWRGLLSRAVYATRTVRRLPVHLFRIAKGGVRMLLVRPFFWTLHRGKLAVHAFQTWRKDLDAGV
jgi:hypothetical protein